MSLFWWFCIAVLVAAILIRMFPSAQKEKSPRHAHILKGILVRDKAVFPIITLNLSTEGAFVKLDERLEILDLPVAEEKRKRQDPSSNPFLSEEEAARSRKNLRNYPGHTGEKVTLCLELKTEGGLFFQGGKLETQAVVAWKSSTKGPLRYGLGLKFVDWPPRQKQRLKDYLRYVQKSAPVIPR